MFKFKKIILSSLAVVSILANADSNKKVDELVHSFMEKNKVSGMSVAIIDKNGKSQVFNYGYADESKKIPISNDTIYRIASFSKTYTATLAAIAATEGKLNLNAPFTQYWPEVKNTNLNKVTTSMLLGHVSSLPFNFDPAPANYKDVVADLDKFIPPETPGSIYGYSNAGIGTAGYVLQNIYAKDYDTLLADKIAKPLNLTSTYLNLPADKEKNVAIGHEPDNTVRPYDRNIDTWFAAASLKSTITDMAKFLTAQINPSALNNKVLSKAIVIMHQNKYCFANKLACEQLGWQAHNISQLNSSVGDTFSNVDKNGKFSFATQKVIPDNNSLAHTKIFIDKSCGGYGMSGYMLYIPEKKTGVVILLNKLVGDDRIQLGRDIIMKYNG